MAQPLDLDALVAETNDSKEPFQFIFGGDTFELPPHADLLAIGKFERGDVIGAMEDLLGGDQFARLKGSGKAFDTRYLQALLNAYGAHVGADANQGG